jgi:hypothetical protein
VIQIGEDWPLLAGDAIQNFRAALDHLMRQFAILKLGRQPTKKETLAVQFPQAHKATQFTPANRHLANVRPVDIARLKASQPYYRRHRRTKGQLHPLPKLIQPSNVDKHRRLHLLVVAPAAGSFTNRADAFRDCVPVLFPAPDGRMLPRFYHKVPGRSPRPNQEILRVEVTPTGPNPDVEIDGSITCQIRVGRLGPVVAMLDGFGQYVTAVLTAFTPRL